MRVFYMNRDCGDGSSTTDFFESKECIDYLLDEETGDDSYWDGDGGSWSWFEVPDGTEIIWPSKYHRIRTLAEIKGDF